MRRIILSVLLICGVGGIVRAQPELLPIVCHNPSQVIKVSKERKRINILLPSNSSTGHQWFLTEYPSQWLQLESHRYIYSPAQGPGTAGSEIFTFKAKDDFFKFPQAAHVNFHYARFWDFLNQDGSNPDGFIQVLNGSLDRKFWIISETPVISIDSPWKPIIPPNHRS